MFSLLRKFLAVALSPAMVAGLLVSSSQASSPRLPPAFSTTKKLPLYKNVKSQGKALGCTWFWVSSPRSYWFQKAQYKVKGELYTGIVQSTQQKGLCYYFLWDQFYVGYGYQHYPNLPLEDVVRTFGYLDYIEKVIHEDDLDSVPDGWPPGKTVRMKLKDITGITFRNQIELIKWFKENETYLFWHPSLSKLRLNKDRKRNRNSYPKRRFYEFGKDSSSDLDRAFYWWSKAMGWIFSEWKAGKFFKGIRFDLNSSRTNIYQYKINRSLLKKHIKTKEKTYIEYIRSHIEFFNNPKKPLGPSLRTINRLKYVTDQNFDTKKEWIEWYQKNKDRLKLSDDGGKIVAH